MPRTVRGEGHWLGGWGGRRGVFEREGPLVFRGGGARGARKARGPPPGRGFPPQAHPRLLGLARPRIRPTRREQEPFVRMNARSTVGKRDLQVSPRWEAPDTVRRSPAKELVADPLGAEPQIAHVGLKGLESTVRAFGDAGDVGCPELLPSSATSRLPHLQRLTRRGFSAVTGSPRRTGIVAAACRRWRRWRDAYLPACRRSPGGRACRSWRLRTAPPGRASRGRRVVVGREVVLLDVDEPGRMQHARIAGAQPAVGWTSVDRSPGLGSR